MQLCSQPTCACCIQTDRDLPRIVPENYQERKNHFHKQTCKQIIDFFLCGCWKQRGVIHCESYEWGRACVREIVENHRECYCGIRNCALQRKSGLCLTRSSSARASPSLFPYLLTPAPRVRTHLLCPSAAKCATRSFTYTSAHTPRVTPIADAGFLGGEEGAYLAFTPPIPEACVTDAGLEVGNYKGVRDP